MVDILAHPLYNNALPWLWDPLDPQSLGRYYVSPTSPPLGMLLNSPGPPECGDCGEVKLGEEQMKYAIIEDGGKQYRAVVGETLDVDLYSSEVGEQIDLEHVLLIAEEGDFTIGTPFINGARVQATVVAQVKGPKVTVFKYRPKKRIRVKTGHRQKYTRIKIDSISLE